MKSKLILSIECCNKNKNALLRNTNTEISTCQNYVLVHKYIYTSVIIYSMMQQASTGQHSVDCGFVRFPHWLGVALQISVQRQYRLYILFSWFYILRNQRYLSYTWFALLSVHMMHFMFHKTYGAITSSQRHGWGFQLLGRNVGQTAQETQNPSQVSAWAVTRFSLALEAGRRGDSGPNNFLIFFWLGSTCHSEVLFTWLMLVSGLVAKKHITTYFHTRLSDAGASLVSHSDPQGLG